MSKMILPTGCSAKRSEAVEMFQKVSETIINRENGYCLNVHALPRGTLIHSRSSQITIQLSDHGSRNAPLGPTSLMLVPNTGRWRFVGLKPRLPGSCLPHGGHHIDRTTSMTIGFLDSYGAESCWPDLMSRSPYLVRRH